MKKRTIFFIVVVWLLIGFVAFLYIIGKPIQDRKRYNEACEKIVSRIFESSYDEAVLMNMALDIFKDKYYQQSKDARDLIAIVYKHLGKFEKVTGVEDTKDAHLKKTRERVFLMTCNIKFTKNEEPLPFHVSYIMDESNIRVHGFLMHKDALKKQIWGNAADFMTGTKK